MRKCIICNNTFNSTKKITCSDYCKEIYNKWNKPPNTSCKECGVSFYLKPSRIKRAKTIYCSQACHNIGKQEYMAGENNHQYNLKGELNSSFKDGIRFDNGYKLIYMPQHPLSHIKSGYIREHRYIAEQYLLTDNNSIVINNEIYLSPNYEVHHIDENKLNNNIDNLLVVTKAEHAKIHDKLSVLERDKNTGRMLPKQ